ncbi:MAG: hypothetical protein A2X45_18020 [Lentisphaerae bacterium GWF2_50_93]|nr:MAG: hypothetical protein A2X45_18020 [Lentisphaerae bacterium GWF2_50_93]
MEQERITWKNDLDTGIQLIDSQHKEFIRLVNSLLDSSLKADDSQTLVKAFSFLRYYVGEHFSVEESAMIAYGYPFYAMHKNIHDSFREEIKAMELTLRTSVSQHEVVIKLNYLIVNWFMNHIKVEDRKLCAYLASQAQDRHEELGGKLDQIVSYFFKKGGAA